MPEYPSIIFVHGAFSRGGHCEAWVRHEQAELTATLGAESGRAFRSMILGTARVQASAVRCPVLCISGARARIVARRVAKAIAAHDSADHHVLEGRGHWLLARTGLETVAGLVWKWLEQKELCRGRVAV